MSARPIRFVAVLLAALAVARSVPASATTWYVRTRGDDRADGKTAKTAFRTLRRAAQALNHGDSIILAPGAYAESVFLAERFSADGAEMRIVGDETGRRTGSPPGPVVLQPARATDVALHLFRLANVRISGLTFRGPGQGLKLQKCRNVVVERCTFAGLARGLAVTGGTSITIRSSVFAQCTIGAFLHRTSRTDIRHVTVAGSASVGVLALSSAAGGIANSLLAGNNTNYIADRISSASWSSDHNVICGNTGAWGDAPAVANIYEWTSASGQERNSVFVVPEFVDPDGFDLHVSPSVTWSGGLPGATVGRPRPGAVDRDGKPFRLRSGRVCAGAYDYPDPKPAPAWRKLTVSLTGKGPRQSAAVYRPDGILVRVLLADAAGVRELWWDGRDDLGRVAPAGRYVVKAVEHDVRIVDDGALGDDGNPMGAYNCDNADQVVALPDGGFVITTVYDEAGYALRRYSSTGQPIFAANLWPKHFAALTIHGEDLYGVVGTKLQAQLMRLTLPGNRAAMSDGRRAYPLFATGEKPGTVTGLAVAGGRAYVAIAGRDLVRAIDLATGRKRTDWSAPNVSDLAADAKGVLWAISGTDVVALNARGRRYPTGLKAPRYLALSPRRIAVVDRAGARIALLDAKAGAVVRTLGDLRKPGAWEPVRGALLRDPRGAAFLPDGRLVVTESARVRILWPESGKTNQDILSNFMDVAVVHPTQSRYVYCAPGVFEADPKTGAWRWLVESPGGQGPPDKKGKPTSLYLGSPSTTVVLGGRAFVAYYQAGRLTMVDVTDPLRPRQAWQKRHKVLSPWAYATVTFGKGGDLISGGHYSPSFRVVPFRGLDAQNNPVFDFDKARSLGPKKDPVAGRDMKPIAGLAADRKTGDLYYMAVTAYNNKMVPAWGADGTGVGKTAADGRPMWFAPSSGGNYMSISMVNDGRRAWVLAGKSFGGQIDLFDGDGLRLTTGNWAWPCNYHIGFVDLRYGVHAYRRDDGKIGAYVEDDAIGRFARCRIDGADTIRKTSAPLAWQPTGALAGAPPDAHRAGGKALSRMQRVPRVRPLKVDGDWRAWARAGVVPQAVCLPVVGFKRSVPGDLWQSFRAGTGIGALAHDGKYLYVYFLVTDDTMFFDSTNPGAMWMFDGIELWLEEEQFGLGFTADGKAALFKYRFHDRKGTQWKAGYGLGPQNVWGRKYDDLSTHPLGRQLATIVGTSLRGRPGYVLMGRIPMIEVKLVGGIAGRGGKQILDMTGKAGEVLRVGVAISGISAWGREQDFKVQWPASMMFSDPTRSTPFVLGGGPAGVPKAGAAK